MILTLKSMLLNLEATTRIGANWRLSLEASFSLNIPGPSTVRIDSWVISKRPMSDSELIFLMMRTLSDYN